MTDSKVLAKEIAKVLDEKKGSDVVAVKTEEVTIVSDYFVIVTGNSSTHTRSLADEVEYEINKRLNIKPEHIEGRATGWILLDYGTVLVHIFDKEMTLEETLSRSNPKAAHNSIRRKNIRSSQKLGPMKKRGETN